MKYKVREGTQIPFVEIEVIPETNEEKHFLESVEPQFVRESNKVLIVFGLKELEE